MESAPQSPQSLVTKTKKHITANPKVTALVVAGLLVVGLGGWSAYSAGYNNGKKAAIAARPSTLAQSNRANSTLPVPTSGEVTDVSGDKITLKVAGNQTKTFTIDDKTKIARKATTLAVSDIQKGSRIVVFALGSSKDVASRIIVQ